MNPYNLSNTMTLAEYDYQVWRKTLHDKQINIDNLENSFWTNVIDNNLEGEALAELEKKFDTDRAVLVNELEAHYAATPQH